MKLHLEQMEEKMGAMQGEREKFKKEIRKIKEVVKKEKEEL